MTPLCELARKYGTDKGGEHLKAGDTCHNYTPTYYEIFKNRREQIKLVLEIGIADGKSLRMWRDFFPHAMIVGVDIQPAYESKDERIVCLQADQSSVTDLQDILSVFSSPPAFDLIVDDGSHVEDHQVLSAQVLLPFLAKDGYYVIEDLYYDCKPQRVGDRIIGPYRWKALDVGHGIGRAHCECGCGAGEQLLMITHEH